MTLFFIPSDHSEIPHGARARRLRGEKQPPGVIAREDRVA